MRIGDALRRYANADTNAVVQGTPATESAAAIAHAAAHGDNNALGVLADFMDDYQHPIAPYLRRAMTGEGEGNNYYHSGLAHATDRDDTGDAPWNYAVTPSYDEGTTGHEGKANVRLGYYHLPQGHYFHVNVRSSDTPPGGGSHERVERSFLLPVTPQEVQSYAQELHNMGGYHHHDAADFERELHNNPIPDELHDYYTTAAGIGPGDPDPAHYARALKRYAAEDWENPDDDRPDTPYTPDNPAAAFHARIAADPEEATNALVYADWLQENGFPAHEKVVRAHAERYGAGGSRRPGDEYGNLAAPGVPWHTAVTAEPMGSVMMAPDRSIPTLLDGIWDVHLAKQVGGSPPAVRWRVPHLHGVEAAGLIRELTAESQRMGGGAGVIHNSNARNLVNHLGRAEAVGQPRTGIREVSEGGESPTLLARAVAGGLRRYASQQDVSAMTAGMTPTDWRGGHGADMTKRSVLADAIQENGDEHTANLLRTPGRHLYLDSGLMLEGDHGIRDATDISRDVYRDSGPMRRQHHLADPFVRQYVETALWSTPDDAGQPLDANYDLNSIHPDTLAAMVADAHTFRSMNESPSGMPSVGMRFDAPEGHNFWLSRNGHGTGFFDHADRYGDELAQRLHDASHGHGEYDLHVGDDGMIHGSYEVPPAADPPVEEADRPPPGGPLTNWPLPDHYRRVGAALKRYDKDTKAARRGKTGILGRVVKKVREFTPEELDGLKVLVHPDGMVWVDEMDWHDGKAGGEVIKHCQGLVGKRNVTVVNEGGKPPGKGWIDATDEADGDGPATKYAAALKRYALYRAPAGGMIAPPAADPLFAGLPGQFVPGGKFVSGAAIEPQKKSEGGRKRFDLEAVRQKLKNKKLVGVKWKRLDGSSHEGIFTEIDNGTLIVRKPDGKMDTVRGMARSYTEAVRRMAKKPKALYRGVSPETGTKSYRQGKGLYVTTSPEVAAGYGEVVKVDHSALPKKPLVLRSEDHWDGWLADQYVNKLGLKNIREFNAKYPDPGEYVRSLGFDGVQLGDGGPDTTYVSYNAPKVGSGEPERNSRKFDFGAIRRKIKAKKVRDDPSSYGPGADALTVSYARAVAGSMKRYAEVPDEPAPSEELSFHRGLIGQYGVNPRELTPHLAYLDWLQDHGRDKLSAAIRSGIEEQGSGNPQVGIHNDTTTLTAEFPATAMNIGRAGELSLWAAKPTRDRVILAATPLEGFGDFRESEGQPFHYRTILAANDAHALADELEQFPYLGDEPGETVGHRLRTYLRTRNLRDTRPRPTTRDAEARENPEQFARALKSAFRATAVEYPEAAGRLQRLRRSLGDAMKRYAAGADLRGLFRRARENPYDDTGHLVIADALEEADPHSPIPELIRRQFGGGQHTEPRNNLWYEPVENSWDGTFPYAARLGRHGPFNLFLRHEGDEQHQGDNQRWVLHAVSNLPGSRDFGYTFEFPHSDAHEIPRMFPAAKRHISDAQMIDSPHDAVGLHQTGGIGRYAQYRNREAERFNDAMDEEERNRG